MTELEKTERAKCLELIRDLSPDRRTAKMQMIVREAGSWFKCQLDAVREPSVTEGVNLAILLDASIKEESPRPSFRSEKIRSFGINLEIHGAEIVKRETDNIFFCCGGMQGVILVSQKPEPDFIFPSDTPEMYPADADTEELFDLMAKARGLP